MSIRNVLRPIVFVALALSAFDVVHAAERGAFSPSAPVRLDYELPESLPSGVSMAVPLQLSTPVKSGQLHIELVGSAGLQVQSSTVADFDLGQTHQLFIYDLRVVLGAEISRYLIVLVSVDGPAGSQSRSYRIDFSAETTASKPAGTGLKLLPSTTPP